MGTMGLALPWKTRISSVQREREMRVEPSENPAGARNQPAVPANPAIAISEDAELAARCQAGDLRAVRVGRNYRLRQGDVDSYLSRGFA